MNRSARPRSPVIEPNHDNRVLIEARRESPGAVEGSSFAAGAGALRRPARMFEALAIRDFRLLWIANPIAAFAMQMQMVARGWLIYHITGSPLRHHAPRHDAHRRSPAADTAGADRHAYRPMYG